MKHKLLSSLAIITSLIALNASAVMAHVIVSPNQVGIGKFQTFSTGVSNEKEIPVTGLRLVIPDSLKYVSPNVKTGWQIVIKKTGDGENAKVTEISWTGGSIPAGFRDEFNFSAQVPASTTTLQWKAYQTYQDGTVVSWDQAPNLNNSDDDSITPYSVTNIVNDLAAESAAVSPDTSAASKATVAIGLGLASFLVGIFALVQKRKG